MSVCSYHTFILPFIWEGSSCVRHTMQDFVTCFSCNPNWECTDVRNEYRLENTPELVSADDLLTFFKEHQYFHPYVRKAIFGYDPSIETNYSFIPGKIRNHGHYYIEKNNRKFDLLINGIKLKIFNTGVALFILECENHGIDADGMPQTSMNDIKQMNDYGRRISLPFIPSTEWEHTSLCADKLTISIDGLPLFESDFLGFIRNLNKNRSSAQQLAQISLTHMCDIIKDILGFGGTIRFTSQRCEEKDQFYIYPALDDRMFVLCAAVNEEQANQFRAFCQNGFEDPYDQKDEVSMRLYEFVFVDPGDGQCTCRSKAMRKELLEKHVYLRWIDYGTLYSIANQSFMMLLNTASESYLFESFLTQYVRMACICLVQRATLIHFQRLASSLSAHIEERGKSINHKTILQLMNLQERFVAYQSQLYFTEVSPQEQAIELYKMLQDSFYIERETVSLYERINSLEDAANTNLDFGFNRIALIFTLVSFVLAVLDDAMCFFDSTHFFGWESPALRVLLLGTTFATFFSFVVVMYLYRRRK